MRRGFLVVVLSLSVGTFACVYTKKRWEVLTEDAKKALAQPRTEEGKCQYQGGILYNGQCYTPSPTEPILNQETCRMRGGLFIDDQCFFVPQEGTAL